MKRETLALTILAAFAIAPGVYASNCVSTTDCKYTFDVHNVGPTTFGSGPYGTLELTLVGSNILVNIDLANGFGLITTGFPAGPGTNYSIGFNDNLAAANFSYSNFTPNTYNSGTTAAGSYQFDGFGDFDRAAATTALGNTSGSNTLSFLITRSGGFTSIQNIVSQSTGNGATPVYFVADVFYNGTNNPGSGCPQWSGCTGLIGVTDPSPLVLKTSSRTANTRCGSW
jgi:hypothetical protein